MTKQQMCRGCTQGDCYQHVQEYLDSASGVRKCTCADPDQRHGKLRDIRIARRKVKR